MSRCASAIRVTPASRWDRRRGLLAYARVELGPYEIDGIAVRRTRGGRLAVSYPRRTAGDGTAHVTFIPTDPRVRAALEQEILAAYRQQEDRA